MGKPENIWGISWTLRRWEVTPGANTLPHSNRASLENIISGFLKREIYTIRCLMWWLLISPSGYCDQVDQFTKHILSTKTSMYEFGNSYQLVSMISLKEFQRYHIKQLPLYHNFYMVQLVLLNGISLTWAVYTTLIDVAVAVIR